MRRPFQRLLVLLLFTLLTVISQAESINLSRYRVVTHSSSSDANHCGHLVVDGNSDTYWESRTSRKKNRVLNESLEIDLASEQLIKEVSINWGSNFATAYSVSLLSASKELVSEIYTTTTGDGLTKKITVAPTTARYIRIAITDVKFPVRGCVINEVEVLGEGEERFKPSSPVTL